MTFAHRILNFFKKRWLLLVIVVLILGVIGFFFYSRSQANQQDLSFTNPEYRKLTKTLEVSGIIDAKEQANLRFALGGKIVYLGAKEGEIVKKGQTIAQIDARDLQKRLQQDLNAFLRERNDFEINQEQYDYNVETLERRRLLDEQQWDLNDTVLNVEIRDLSIQDTRLNAPFAGILVNSPVISTGINVLASEAFELVNPNTLVFKAAVDEADIANVTLGQTGRINLDAYPEEELTATVSSIDYKSQVSSSGTVFIVELPLTIPDLTGSTLLNKYRLGMNGDVTLELAEKDNVLSIPLDATRQRDGKTYVDVRTGEDTFAEREIQVGLETDDWIEVTGGLSTTDEVLLPETAE